MKRLATRSNDKVIPLITLREKEILYLIAYEYTTDEIAEELFISHHTVVSHRKNMMEKLKVRNIAGLVRVGCQTGIIK